jgi:omega-6 fatty acid desaturase (delta-12 desaturase)
MQMHHAYDHGAHHVCPSIPCYMLERAQSRLNELLGNRAVIQIFSLTWLITTMRTCKLYDYDKHRWLDFNGKPANGRILPANDVKYADAA